METGSSTPRLSYGSPGHPRYLALCRLRLDAAERAAWVAKIRDEYRAQLLLDNLPVATRLPSRRAGGSRLDRGAGLTYQRGYSLGAVDPQTGAVLVHNHLQFTVYFSAADGAATADSLSGGGQAGERADGSAGGAAAGGGTARIVGFEVTPTSRAYRHSLAWPDDFEGPDGKAYEVLNLDPARVGLSHEEGTPMRLDPPPHGARGEAPVELIFTYEVAYLPSSVPYASRWDVYLQLEEGSQVHWLSLFGSLSLCLLMAAAVAAILLATVRRDLQKYNAVNLDDEIESLVSDIGWKYVHADVLRTPPAPLALAAATGAAVQLWSAAVATLALALLGLVSPTARGRMLSAALLLLGVSAVPAGYTAARVYQQVTRGQREGGHTLVAVLSLALPGGIFAAFTLLDVALWAQGASSAVPFSTMALLLLLWLGVHVPLLALGSALGFRRAPDETHVFTNQIARSVPPQPLYLHPALTGLLGGFLPYGTAAIELSSLYASAWNGRVYSLFGFLVLMVLTSALVCTEVSILLTYLQICREDYRWWWRSFAHTGSAGLYFFGNAAAYAHTELHLKGTTAVAIYYGYTAATAAALCLMTGALGFLSSYWFVRTIYAAVKVD